MLLKDLPKPLMPNRTYMSENHFEKGFQYCYPNINLRGGVIYVEANFFDLNAELKTIFN